MQYLLINPLKLQLVILLTIITIISSAQNSSGFLEKGFKNPPEQARPRTWWHWTNSNITKDGITKDLEWMKRVGIGGMQLADVASGQGQTVEKKIIFDSPEWLDAVRLAASEAQRLNLEMTIFSSAGWSLTGGPWVKQEQAMKKLVWSETNINGPIQFKGALAQPPSCEGPIGNMARSAQNSEPSYYKDCIVLAFRTPADEDDFMKSHYVVSTGTGPTDTRYLTDNDLNTSVRIRASKETKSAWLQFTFDQPYRAQAITLASRNGIPFCTLSASDDGKEFRTLAILPGPQLYRAGKVETVTFPESVAKYYRLEFSGAPTDTLWMFPYRSDITMLLKKGNNKLEIKVTNQWTNRLLGDRAAVSGQKVLNSNLFVPARQLNESGLLGPVKILCSNIPDNKD